MQRGLLAVAAATLLGSCGAPQEAPSAAVAPTRSLDAVVLLRDDVLPRFEQLREPPETAAALGDAAAGARGDARRDAWVRVAAKRFWNAEKDAAHATRERREAAKVIGFATRHASGYSHLPEALLLEALIELRSDRPDAARRSLEEILANQNAPGEIVHCARLLEGEIELLRSQYDAALQAYRYVVVEIDSDLYPLALYRTAQAYLEVGRSADARQALNDLLDSVHRRPAVGREPLRLAAERELAALAAPPAAAPAPTAAAPSAPASKSATKARPGRR